MTETVTEFDLNGLHLVICIPAYDAKMPTDQTVSVVNTINTLKTHGVSTTVEFRAGSALIEKARAELLHAFLSHTNGTHMLFVDSDIIWEPEAAVRLLAFCTEHDAVCVPYPTKEDPPNFHYSLVSGEDGRVTQNLRGLLKIKSAPMGFNCFSRKGLQAVCDAHPELYCEAQRGDFKGEMVPHLFHTKVAKNEDGVMRFVGEDIAFYQRWMEVHGEAWLDPYSKLQHVGKKAYEKDFIEFVREKNRESQEQLAESGLYHPDPEQSAA